MLNDVLTLVQQLKQQLQETAGELSYWGPALTMHPPLEPVKTDAVPAKEKLMPGLPPGALDKPGLLTALKDHTIGDCRRCPLGDTRIKLVFGVGNPETRVLFVGEGPGFDEDRRGEPFVGKAGQLLDRIMAAIDLNRANAYIANVVKCHPMVDPSKAEQRGNDRPPMPEEMEKCLPFLREQIVIIQPEVIVTLGATATRALLARSGGISLLRGRFYDFSLPGLSKPCFLLPTFHPAALLRDESLKKWVWEDMKMLREHLKGAEA